MNDIAMREVVQKAAKPKFYGHDKLKAKGKPFYPDSMIREYSRITNGYMVLLNKAVAEYMPEIKAAIQQEQKQTARADSLSDLWTVIRQAFIKIATKFEKLTEAYNLEKKLNNLASLTRKLSIKEWKKVVKNTLGIDLLDDYYLGEFYREQLKKWTEENVGLIKTIPHNALGKMEDIVLKAYSAGRPTSAIVKEIQRAYGTEKRHARLIARDQMAKLNASIAKHQQQDAGVEEYEWSTTGDGRVRERHRALNGKTFRWDNPPVVDLRTGRRCHPGEDYQCRCVARPKFNINTLNLPMAQPGENMKGGDAYALRDLSR